jgi:hypothetical protein
MPNPHRNGLNASIIKQNGTTGVVVPAGKTLAVDVISEVTGAAGVTVDGVLLKDSAVTGNVTGNITGNVTGNLTGNVTGNVTGNTSGTAGGLLAAAVFLSAELTGNGSSQDTAHGFGATPKLVFVIPSDLSGGAFTVTYGTHDATNTKTTVTNAEKYRVVAFK